MKILRFSEFLPSNEFDSSAHYFIELFTNSPVNENLFDKESVKLILKKLSNDLKFNISLITTFGAGVSFMMPIISELIKNSKISVDLSDENLALLTITVLSIVYLEESKNKTGQKLNPDGTKSKVSKEDTDTLLTELKLRGIGNGIVKKIVKIFLTIGDFFKKFLKKTKFAINGLIDMFAYSALLMPAMNALLLFIGKYELTFETIVGNLLSLGASTTALLSKQGINWLVDKLKKNLNIDASNREDSRIFNQEDILDREEDLFKSKKVDLIKEKDKKINHNNSLYLRPCLKE
jgi:hypothetical protein